jgi:hypothetical protein
MLVINTIDNLSLIRQTSAGIWTVEVALWKLSIYSNMLQKGLA